jgi:hypothetical protein
MKSSPGFMLTLSVLACTALTTIAGRVKNKMNNSENVLESLITSQILYRVDIFFEGSVEQICRLI